MAVGDSVDSQPDLNSLTINVTVDREVISHNADATNKNVYTWYINRENYGNKSINLTLSDISNSSSSSQSSINTNSSSSSSTKKNETNSDDYIIYIVLGIFIIIFIIGYMLFNKMKERNNKLDD